MKTAIDLIDVNIEVEHEYNPATTGGSDDQNNTEQISHSVSITSVKAIPYGFADRAIEILPLLTDDQINSLSEKILESY